MIIRILKRLFINFSSAIGVLFIGLAFTLSILVIGWVLVFWKGPAVLLFVIFCFTIGMATYEDLKKEKGGDAACSQTKKG